MAARGEADLEAEIDDLYGLELEEFTAARDALAKRLRAEKQQAEAQAVAHLQKPNRTAWTVNQVYRDQGETFEALFAAGDRARAAQLMAFAGGRPEPLRDALEDEAKAIAALVKAARAALEEAGYGTGGPQLQPVEDTLRALARRPDGRTIVDRGRLVREVDPPGFEVFAGLGAGPAPAPPRRAAEKAPAPKEPPKKAAPARKHAAEEAEDEEKAARKVAGDKRRAEVAAKRARAAGGGQRPGESKREQAKREAEEKRRAREAEEEAARKAEEKRKAHEEKRQAEEARKRLTELRGRIRAAKAEVARQQKQAKALEASAAEAARVAKEAAKEAERAQAEAQAANEELARAREALAALESEAEAQ